MSNNQQYSVDINSDELLPLDFTRIKPDILGHKIPRHVAVVMDGNGRWANERGMPRTSGHVKGEEALLDVVAGAVQSGVKHLSAYAFSTENWKRSPEEVKFLMGYNREVLRRRRKQFNAWGVKVVWSGRKPRLWQSVMTELKKAEEETKNNTVMTLNMCINYGGRQEIIDAISGIVKDVDAKKISGKKIDEKLLSKYLYSPDIPDVDLFIRSSGEKRTSNFLLWQSAYAEYYFSEKLWPDFDRQELWRAIADYQGRNRRFGGAVDKPKG